MDEVILHLVSNVRLAVLQELLMDEVIATAGGCCVCKLLCGGGAVGVVVCVSCCVGVVQ